MKLLIIPLSGDDSDFFEVEVTREYGNGSINQYGVKHKDYKAYQFDDYDRPDNYQKDWAQTKFFHGFLIGKKGKSHLECNIKVIY